MKKIANAEKYVDDIVKELPPSPHTRRFREELLEHMSDAEEDLRNQENNLNQIKTKVMQKIGDKDTLTKSYVDFYRNSLSSLWPIELLIYIALSLCVFLVTALILSPYELITDSSLWILKIVVIIFSILVAYAFNRIVYTFAAKRLLPHIKSKKGRVLIAWSLVIMPILSFLYGWTYILYWEVQKSGLEFFMSEYFAITVLKFAIMHLAAAVAFGIIPRRSKKSFSGSAKIPYLCLLMFLALMPCSILLAQQKTGTLSAPWQVVKALVVFLELPISIIYSFLDGMNLNTPSGSQFFSPNILAALDSATFFKFFIALLVMAAIGGLWLIVSAGKTKSPIQKSWKRVTGIALVAYAAFILLPINKVQETDSVLNVPAFNVTRTIEQNQQGLLYPALKYVQQNIGNNTSYMAYQDGNLFTVAQSYGTTGRYFLIDVATVPEGQVPTVSAQVNTAIDPYALEFSLGEGILPQGFKCPDCEKNNEYDKEGNLVTLYYDAFTSLTYNGHKLFNAENLTTNIFDLKVSDNQEWALVELGDGRMYMIDLRDLK